MVSVASLFSFPTESRALRSSSTVRELRKPGATFLLVIDRMRAPDEHPVAHLLLGIDDAVQVNLRLIEDLLHDCFGRAGVGDRTGCEIEQGSGGA